MMDSIHAGTWFEVNCHEKMIHECEYKFYMGVAPSQETTSLNSLDCYITMML